MCLFCEHGQSTLCSNCMACNGSPTPLSAQTHLACSLSRARQRTRTMKPTGAQGHDSRQLFAQPEHAGTSHRQWENTTFLQQQPGNRTSPGPFCAQALGQTRVLANGPLGVLIYSSQPPDLQDCIFCAGRPLKKVLNGPAAKFSLHIVGAPGLEAHGQRL